MAQMRTKVAASGTVAALGALAAVALSTQDGATATTTATPASAPAVVTTDAPVEVRTVVVRKVVHRTKRVAPAPTVVAPVTQRVVATPAVAVVRTPTPTPALSTRSSGGGGGESEDHGREAEHEDGFEAERADD